MPLRPHFLQAVEGVLDFALVTATAVASGASSIVASIRGAGPEDDESDDEDGYEEADAELWGLASILYRPQDGAEAVMHRRGDERVVIATKDRRWQSEHTIEKGEVVLRYCGDTGGSGPSVRPIVHLKANGDVLVMGAKIVLDADNVYVGTASATEKMALGTTLKSYLADLKTWADGHTHGYLGDSGAPALSSPPTTTSAPPWTPFNPSPSIPTIESSKHKVEG